MLFLLCIRDIAGCDDCIDVYIYKRSLPNFTCFCGSLTSLVFDIHKATTLGSEHNSSFSLKKIELLIVPLSLLFLSLVKQTRMRETSNPASNSNNSLNSDISLTRNESINNKGGGG